MRKLLLSSTLLLIALLAPPSSRAQFIVTGQACGASGLNGISTTGVPVVCTGNPLVWTVPGSSGGSGASAQNAIFAKDKGVVADGLRVFDASWNNAATPVVVTSATANFSASRDNGKSCWGIGTSGLNSAPLGTLTVVNATTANCSGTSTASASAAGFAWGTNDDAAWALVRTAAAASQSPTCIIGPNGASIVSKSPLIDPRVSTPLWSWCFSGPVGGLTTFMTTPTFDGTTCTGPIAGGCIWEAQQGGITQNIIPQYSKLDNIAVDGLGFSQCGAAFANKAAFGLLHTEGHNIWVWNWCTGVAAVTGINVQPPDSLFNLNVNGSGSTGILISAPGAAAPILIASSYAGAQTSGTDINVQSPAILVSKSNSWQGCGTQCIIVGGTMIMDGDIGFGNSGNQYVDVFGTLIVEGGTQIIPGNNAGSTILTRNGAHVFVRDATIKETGTGGVAFNINTVPGGTIINNGNVQTVGTDQTLLAASNVVLSAGWGTTASVGSLSGTPLSNPTRFQFTVTSSGTGQAANPTMAITYPGTGGTITQPYWTCKQTGGTGTNTSITGEGTATTTSMTLTFNGTPVATSTYQITCQGSLL